MQVKLVLAEQSDKEEELDVRWDKRAFVETVAKCKGLMFDESDVWNGLLKEALYGFEGFCESGGIFSFSSSSSIWPFIWRLCHEYMPLLSFRSVIKILNNTSKELYIAVRETFHDMSYITAPGRTGAVLQPKKQKQTRHKLLGLSL